MNQQTDKAILVVSFGTSYEASRKATIEKIEQDIRNAFQDHRIYRAWTSKFIISILKKRDNYTVPTVKEALEQMITDGIREVVVQPTHILDGIENNIMKEEVLSYKESFDKIAFGTPLLADSKDESQAINAVTTEFSDLKETEALVFMGHGTTHQVNTVYAGLDQKFKESAHANVFIGTVEADPTIHNLAIMHTMIWLVILRIPGYVSLKMPDLKSVRSSKDWVNILEYAGCMWSMHKKPLIP